MSTAITEKTEYFGKYDRKNSSAQIIKVYKVANIMGRILTFTPIVWILFFIILTLLVNSMKG